MRKKEEFRLPNRLDKIDGGRHDSALNSRFMEKQLESVFPGKMESSERFAMMISKLQTENVELRKSLEESKSTILELKREVRRLRKDG